MTEEEILEVSREAILALLSVSLPVMLTALAVGLIVSLFQALTSIQEMTLTFVPKILVLFTSLLFLMPYIIDQLSDFSHSIFDRIMNFG